MTAPRRFFLVEETKHGWLVRDAGNNESFSSEPHPNDVISAQADLRLVLNALHAHATAPLKAAEEDEPAAAPPPGEEPF